MKDRTLIIDGNNLVWRVFYVAESVNPGGMDGLLHVHMFLTAIKTYSELYKPDKIVCCWDKRLDRCQNYRETILPDYKQQRDKDKSKDVHCETELIENLIECLGVINFYPRRLEADDCIAWLCNEQPGEKIIVSVDKDMLQLVREDRPGGKPGRVAFYDPMKKVEVNMRNFQDNSKHGYATYLEEKCFAGDRSDNVPGIHGFGPKKVEKWLNRQVELTEEQKEQFDLNMKLFRLDLYKTVPEEVEYYESQELKKNIQWEAFLKLCDQKGLKSIIKNKDSFYNEFCMEVKLTNMFENLFS